MNFRWPMVCLVVVTLLGCSSMYYEAMEKVGIHKREIMVDRVKSARDSQGEAKKQFLTTMEQFRSVVSFQGGNLEREYNRLNATLQKSEAKADEVSERIDAVEDVSEALFNEWRAEIKQYSSDSLRPIRAGLDSSTRSGFVHEAQFECQGHCRFEQRNDQRASECRHINPRHGEGHRSSRRLYCRAPG